MEKIREQLVTTQWSDPVFGFRRRHLLCEQMNNAMANFVRSLVSVGRLRGVEPVFRVI